MGNIHFFILKKWRENYVLLFCEGNFSVSISVRAIMLGLATNELMDYLQCLQKIQLHVISLL